MSIEKPSSTKNTVYINSDYNVKIKDDVINVDTTGGAVTLYLPNIKNSGFLGYPKTYCINDVGGAAGTNPITIVGLGGDLVNGGVSTVIQKDMGSGFADICNVNEWLVSKDTDSATSGIGGGGMTNFIPKFTSTTTIGNSTMYQADTGVSIGTTTPDASAIFQLDSTEQGFLPPRMDTADRNAITPVAGLTIYNTDTNQIEFWNGTIWAAHTETTIYSGDGVVGSNRVATVTDRLTWTGGTTVSTYTSGSNTITAGTGSNTIGFGTFGNMSLLNMGSTFDHFGGSYAFGAYPLWQSQIYNNATFVENAQFYAGVANFSGTDRPYSGLAYTAPDTSLKGFEANFFGERILSQASGLNRLSALGAANGIAFLSGAGSTGYIGVADQTGFASWIGTTLNQNLQSVMDTGSVATDIATDVEIRRGTATNQGSLLLQQDSLSLGVIEIGAPVYSAGFAATKSGGAVQVSMTYSQLPDTGGLTMNETEQVVRDDFNSKGLIYYGDYEAQFTARSLVTKQYVDGQTFYNSDGAITGNRTVTGDESDWLFTTTNFRALTGDGAYIEARFDEVNLYGGGGVNARAVLNLNQAASPQQRIVFEDLGATAFNGTLQNADLTAARTWTLPDETGTIALVTGGAGISDDVIPRGTGTSIEDGTWSNVGNDIYPVTTGSNIGDATHRIGTIFMSSTVDYSTTLALNSGGTNYFQFGTDGRFTSDQFSTTVTNSTPVWDISANVTERSGGDGYSVYSFTSTFAGAASSNHFRTMYVQAPTGGVNPSFGRYAIWGDAIYTSGSGNDRGVGVYGRAGYNTTQGYAVYGHLVGTPATARNRAVFGFAQTINSGAASAGQVEAGYFQASRQYDQHTGAYYGVQGIATSGGTGTGIGLNVGVEGWASGGATNYAFRAQANRGRIVFGTLNSALNSYMTVRGETSDSSTNIATFDKLSGTPALRVRADGLSQFNTTLEQLSGNGGAYPTLNMIADWTTTETALNAAGVGFRTTLNPSADGTSRITALRVTGTKTGTFNAGQIIGIQGEVLNTGSGSMTGSSVYGLYGGIFTTGNTVNNGTYQNMFALETNTTNQAAATYVDTGGLSIKFDNNTNMTATSQYGIKINAHSNITGAAITNFYGLYISSTTLAPTNYYGVYQQEADAQNWFNGTLSIGSFIANANTQLNVRGKATTVNLALYEDSSGIDRYVQNTDGQMATGAGTSALINTQFGQIHRTANYAYGVGFYPSNATTAGVTIQMLGTTSTGLSIATQGAPTGTVYGVRAQLGSTAATANYGVSGVAQNGSQYGVGVRGEVAGGGTVISSVAKIGVWGASASNLDDTQWGVYGTSQGNSAGVVYTKQFIGVHGYGSLGGVSAGSSVDTIGGYFRSTTGANTTGFNVALMVPSTGNTGTVVFGADSPSANVSFVEIHNGNLEIIGANTGIILQDRTLGTRYEVYMDNGTLQSNAL